MRVWTKKPLGTFHFDYMDNDLKTLQDFVGGYIETLTIKDEPDREEWAVIICNEEGLLYDDFTENIIIEGHTFVGNIIICGQDGDEFTDAPQWVSEFTIAYNRHSGFNSPCVELFEEAMSGEPV